MLTAIAAVQYNVDYSHGIGDRHLAVTVHITYDMAIAWQNCGYNQPPHLGYSPITYYKELATPIFAVADDTNIGREPANTLWYDLMGRSLDNPSQPGIFIEQQPDGSRRKIFRSE